MEDSPSTNQPPTPKPISLGAMLHQEPPSMPSTPPPPAAPSQTPSQPIHETRSTKKRKAVHFDPTLPSPPPHSPPPSSSSTLTQTPTHVYVIKAIEGWRTRVEPKLSISILGVFHTAESANVAARKWLKQRWPAGYGMAKEEVVEGGGVAVEVLTDKDDGVVFVGVERWEVK
ncbi:MAG: hypothetical protein LQ338_004417 [Usnochroma carphineum]|nr:MAG: hypothetical protein LQ338_004417 [Usnochroma carphineum]